MKGRGEQQNDSNAFKLDNFPIEKKSANIDINGGWSLAREIKAIFSTISLSREQALIKVL